MEPSGEQEHAGEQGKSKILVSKFKTFHAKTPKSVMANRVRRTHGCSLQDLTRSDHKTLFCSDHSGGPPPSLCSDRSQGCPHTDPHPLSHQRCRNSLWGGGTTQQTLSWLKSLWGHAAHLHLRMHASGRSIRLRGFGWYPGAQRSQFGPVVWCMQLSHTPPLRRPLDSNSAQSKWQLCAWLLHSHPEGDRGVQGHVKNRKLQLRPSCRLSTVRKLISAQHCSTFLPNMRSHMKSGVCLL